MQPFIKWPGGKHDELKIIIPNLPVTINRFIEPFVGGGAVYFAVRNCNAFLINDKSRELIGLYEVIRDQDQDFLGKLEQINHNWVLLEEVIGNHSADLLNMYRVYRENIIDDKTLGVRIEHFIERYQEDFNGLLRRDFNIDLEHFISQIKRNLISKTRRMKKIEILAGNLSDEDILQNIESAFKSGTYMHFRHLYNNLRDYNIGRSFELALFYFIREYCYSSMFRYNSRGKFNVPYGGISYNRKNFSTKIIKLSDRETIERLNHTTICGLDFEDFLNQLQPGPNDFIFLDPPYDTDFSTYAQNTFDQNDQIRLANYLRNTTANFMIVIKNTEFIYDLYKDFNIISFDKKYLVSFQNRNEKNAEHLLITNYRINLGDENG